MTDAHTGRLHGFNCGSASGLDAWYPDLRGMSRDYRIGFAMGYCEGVDIFMALEQM